MEQFINLDEYYAGCSVLFSDDGSVTISDGDGSIELNNVQAMKVLNVLLAHSRREMAGDLRMTAFDLPEIMVRS